MDVVLRVGCHSHARALQALQRDAQLTKACRWWEWGVGFGFAQLRVGESQAGGGRRCTMGEKACFAEYQV